MMMYYCADPRQYGIYLFCMIKKYDVACGDVIYASFLEFPRKTILSRRALFVGSKLSA